MGRAIPCLQLAAIFGQCCAPERARLTVRCRAPFVSDDFCPQQRAGPQQQRPNDLISRASPAPPRDVDHHFRSRAAPL